MREEQSALQRITERLRAVGECPSYAAPSLGYAGPEGERNLPFPLRTPPKPPVRYVGRKKLEGG
jgi:hypothetical protein